MSITLCTHQQFSFPRVGEAGCERQNPLPQGNTLRGLWGSAGNDVFAVGYSGKIIHYNGSTWNEMSSGTSNRLYGVWGSSGSDVFAVGQGGNIIRWQWYR